MNPLPDWQEELALLAKAYTDEVPSKLAQMRSIWSQFCEQKDQRLLSTLHRLAHNMAGSAATFGLSSLSDQARRFDLFLKKILDTQLPPNNDQEQQVLAFLDTLYRVSPQAQVEKVTVFEDSQSLGLEQTQRGNPSQRQNKLVLIVDDDPALATELGLQISYFGYQVKIFNHLAELNQAIDEQIPAALILDIIFPEGNLAGIEAFERIQKKQAVHIPLIFTSVRNDMEARLYAVRAKGDAYFTKPIQVGALIDKLDALTSHPQEEPFRVLIVDDEASLAQYHAAILRQAGMVTHCVSDPMQVLQPLHDFRPDLILIDIYMPQCTGLELATVIRQQETYVSVPIVFLSTETNQGKQQDAMRLGGDDFLTKPIRPERLIGAITSRVERYRTLRSLMIRDGLTGLLNHTHLKEQLDLELLRAQKYQQPLAFGMIDLDHFKTVNDSYGHASGDGVLKSLARLLRQRLRQTDIIGRYGGEEFAVILPNTTPVAAVQVMNEIRDGFAQIHHYANGKEFTVTLSCGIAGFPDYGDQRSLCDAADEALYRAKHSGRNCVVLARPQKHREAT
ncbi:MAG: diguanylate cyclase [Thermostichales cyanobacterium HHBFW_bins_127]